jgi:hypothetical protein
MKDGLLGTNLKTEKIAPMPCRVRSLSLAPANSAGGKTICSFSNAACRKACISETGQYRFDYARAVRAAKTQALLNEPIAFARMLIAALLAETHRAIRVGLPIFHRLNTLSDIPWEVFIPGLFDLFAQFPVRFYDYTKIPGRIVPVNYHLTFSRSGTNDRHVESEIAAGRNIAVIFETENDFPATWNGIEVINGDTHDVRALDPIQRIVALRFKKPATGATARNSGSFVVLA